VRNVEAALNGLLGRLEDSIARNKRFVSNASHQLRTPVSALVAQAELALREEDGPGRAPLVRMHASAVRMSRLIGQLLSLARADAFDRGQQALDEIEAVGLFRELTAASVPGAIERDIDLGFEPGEAPAPVLGDATLLEEMLRNLLDNACSYCPPGSEVTVRAGREGGRLVLEVVDDGPGIAAPDREHVLERFTRLNGERDDGSGLGLPIAVEIAELHGGTLSLGQRSGGKGLRVRVEIPTAG